MTNLGLARPYIGAIFALLLLLHRPGRPAHRRCGHRADERAAQFAFFVAFGFLIGFSERFAKEIVRSAESGRAATEGLGAEIGTQRVDRRAQGIQVGA